MALQAPSLVPMGGFLMTILTEGSTPQMYPLQAQLDAWNQRANAPFSMVLDSEDPQPRMEQFFARPRDTYIQIDLSTMRIVEIITGDVQTALTNFRTRLQ
jgi:hypothetical protein